MDDLDIDSRLTIPASELTESFARSGGPGGQHVNKTSSKVELRWDLVGSRVLDPADRALLVARLRLTREGELLVTSERERDQSRNRRDARHKMATVVRAALVRPKRRKRTRPSKGAVKRRLESKKKRGALKTSRRRDAGSGMD